MPKQATAAPAPLSLRESDPDAAWRIVVVAASCAERLEHNSQPAAFAYRDAGGLQQVAADHPDALIAWTPGVGWECLLPQTDPRHGLIDLYLPISGATSARRIAVGHLGQSLDGFIATHAGESQYVTGRENILHLHRMRGLSDAVIVGAGTVAADDPQLTTRHVAGPSPLRVVLDPTRRLADHYKVFNDDSATTLYVCARSFVRPGEKRVGRANILALSDSPGGVDVTELVQVLHARGCRRIFVEGGGVTVSAFLEANVLDRLQVAIAPLIIGDGRPAIRLTPRAALSDCHRPHYRVFRMGGDMLYDCELRSPKSAADRDRLENAPGVTRVI